MFSNTAMRSSSIANNLLFNQIPKLANICLVNSFHCPLLTLTFRTSCRIKWLLFLWDLKFHHSRRLKPLFCAVEPPSTYHPDYNTCSTKMKWTEHARRLVSATVTHVKPSVDSTKCTWLLLIEMKRLALLLWVQRSWTLNLLIPNCIVQDFFL